MSKRGETLFDVSFDGSFSQRLEDTQFIVSLPIIQGSGSSELKDYLPKRAADPSDDSSESEEKEPPVRSGMNLRETLEDLVSSEGEEEKVEEMGPPPPSALRPSLGMRMK